MQNGQLYNAEDGRKALRDVFALGLFDNVQIFPRPSQKDESKAHPLPSFPVAPLHDTLPQQMQLQALRHAMISLGWMKLVVLCKDQQCYQISLQIASKCHFISWLRLCEGRYTCSK